MANTKQMIHIKRIYEPAAPGDGLRVLVDRLWPRGLSKRAANIDLWAKELAPTVPLRRWFHKDPSGRWKEFATRYRKELRGHKDALTDFRTQVRKSRKVTLLYAGADTEHSHAQVLLKFLSNKA